MSNNTVAFDANEPLVEFKQPAPYRPEIRGF